MPRDIGVGDIETDAVPGPVPVEGRLDEDQTTANALPGRFRDRLG